MHLTNSDLLKVCNCFGVFFGFISWSVIVLFLSSFCFLFDCAASSFFLFLFVVAHSFILLLSVFLLFVSRWLVFLSSFWLIFCLLFSFVSVDSLALFSLMLLGVVVMGVGLFVSFFGWGVLFLHWLYLWFFSCVLVLKCCPHSSFVRLNLVSFRYSSSRSLFLGLWLLRACMFSNFLLQVGQRIPVLVSSFCFPSIWVVR